MQLVLLEILETDPLFHFRHEANLKQQPHSTNNHIRFIACFLWLVLSCALLRYVYFLEKFILIFL